MSQENSSQGEGQESEARIDRVERALEHMVTYMQGTQPPGQNTSRVLDTIDRFQRLSPPVFRGKANANPSESEYWIE